MVKNKEFKNKSQLLVKAIFMSIDKDLYVFY
jgi:hypothetical protein